MPQQILLSLLVMAVMAVCTVQNAIALGINSRFSYLLIFQN